MPRTLQSWVIRVSLLISGLFLINFVISPFLVGIPKLTEICRPRITSEFTAEKWKRATADAAARYAMANSLVASRALVLASEARVYELLGTPKHRSSSGDLLILDYELAPQEQFPASCWLYPKFFPNIEMWVLRISLSNGVVNHFSVTGS
jgi:hypothetical protein